MKCVDFPVGNVVDYRLGDVGEWHKKALYPSSVSDDHIIPKAEGCGLVRVVWLARELNK